MKKENRGGARKGAGRPLKNGDEKKVYMTLTLSKKVKEKIIETAKEKNKSRGALIEDIFSALI